MHKVCTQELNTVKIKWCYEAMTEFLDKIFGHPGKLPQQLIVLFPHQNIPLQYTSLFPRGSVLFHIDSVSQFPITRVVIEAQSPHSIGLSACNQSNACLTFIHDFSLLPENRQFTEGKTITGQIIPEEN